MCLLLVVSSSILVFLIVSISVLVALGSVCHVPLLYYLHKVEQHSLSFLAPPSKHYNLSLRPAMTVKPVEWATGVRSTMHVTGE